MSITLITWACGHFCTKWTPAYASDKSFLAAVAQDFWFLADSADEDLANVATECHLACDDNCPKCQEPVSVSFGQVRAQSGIDNLNILHSGMKEIYLGLGAKYYQLDFSQKAKFAHDGRCALAHKQFWISKVVRSKDDFFVPMMKIARLGEEADRATQSSKTHADVKKAFVHINIDRKGHSHTAALPARSNCIFCDPKLQGLQSSMVLEAHNLDDPQFILFLCHLCLIVLIALYSPQAHNYFAPRLRRFTLIQA